MTVTVVRLDDTYFPTILSGKKTVDSRINKPPYKTLDAGSVIKFVGAQDLSLEAYYRVEKRSDYNTFQEMLISEGVSNCLPGIATIEEALKIYLSFPDYRALEKSCGVVAFRITPLPK